MSSKKSAAQKREARERAAAIVAQQKSQARRRTLLIQGVVGGVVVLLVVVLTVTLLQRQDDSAADAARPTGVDAQGRFVVGDAQAPVTVEVVEDFQCPVCKRFEESTGDLLKSYAEGSDVAVAYRPIAFLDRASSTEYSSRALNAAACVMDDGQDVWAKYHELLYANQPEEGGAGLTDEQLVALAVQAGAPEAKTKKCVDAGTYRDWAKATTTKAGDDGVTGTPTVYVDGKQVDSPSPQTVQAAVEAAS